MTPRGRPWLLDDGERINVNSLSASCRYVSLLASPRDCFLIWLGPSNRGFLTHHLLSCVSFLRALRVLSRTLSSSSDVSSIPPIGCFLVDVFLVPYILLWFLICCFSFHLYPTSSSPSSTCPVGLLEAPAVRAAPPPCFAGG